LEQVAGRKVKFLVGYQDCIAYHLRHLADLFTDPSYPSASQLYNKDQGFTKCRENLIDNGGGFRHAKTSAKMESQILGMIPSLM
jgi:hypothetical protein